MVKRCNDKTCCGYGARGIKVCDEWLVFESFKQWAILNGYKEGLSIERTNVNGNYEPSNCKWITMLEQANNRRNNRIETYKGITDTVANLCRIFNKDYALVNCRLQRGSSIEEAFDKPKGYSKKRNRYITYNDETHTLSEWTKLLGFKKNTISERLKSGWNVEKALTTPTGK